MYSHTHTLVVACLAATSITIRFVMFIIVIIIIIKSTRLDSIDYKSSQRGVARGGGRGEHPLAKSIECYKWLKNLWALRSHDKHPTPSPIFLSLSHSFSPLPANPMPNPTPWRGACATCAQTLSLSPTLSLSIPFSLFWLPVIVCDL